MNLSEDEVSLNETYLSRSAAQWTAWFKYNRQHLMSIPWEAEKFLTANEKNAIAKSIAIFQLGESSDGELFRNAAKKYASRTGEMSYVDAQDLFIQEEQRHAEVLGRFMKREGIPEKDVQWTDTVFRALRHLGRLELCISVLITAELIASVYYEALKQSTTSPVLRKICEQILADEEQHIYFQAGTLAKIREVKGLWALAFIELMHRALMLGVVCVVWWDHRRVFKAANMNFGYFFRRSFEALEHKLQIVRENIVLEWRRRRTKPRVIKV